MPYIHNRIQIAKELEKHYDWVELQWRSSRNKPVSRHSDISPLEPDQKQAYERVAKREGDLWFPVVDVRVDADMAAIGCFSGEGFEYSFNAHIDPRILPGQKLVAWRADQLEQWDNILFLSDTKACLTDFCLVKRVRLLPRTQCRVTAVFTPLALDVEGEIRAFGIEPDGSRTALFTEEIVSPRQQHRQDSPSGALDRESLQRGILAGAEYILRSVNKAPHSPYYEGLYLFYDLDARTYRMPSWAWEWGPSIHALLRASRLDFVDAATSARLRDAAWRIGNTTLKFQVHNPGHETHGMGCFRNDPWHTRPGLVELICSGSDSGFLAGWAWIPLYKETGDKRFLSAALSLARSIKDTINRFDHLLPQDYNTDFMAFTKHTLDESGFGTEGLAELYLLTGESWVKELCALYMRTHTDAMEDPDTGLWAGVYHSPDNRTDPVNYRTRGTGWSMEGLLSCARAIPDGPYLDKAIRMGEHLLKWQHADGFWSYFFTQPAERVGISEKGTPLWSILFSRLYDFTRDPRHLKAAQKALSWSLKNQYFGEDPMAHGGIVACSPQSGIMYRPWFHMTCAYTTAFLTTAACMEYERQANAYVPYNLPEGGVNRRKERKRSLQRSSWGLTR